MFSLHPWRIGLPCGDRNVTYSFINTTVQFASQIGPTPMSVFVKVGMMYPFVGKSEFNCGMGSIAVSIEISTCPFAVHTLICFSVVLIFPYGKWCYVHVCCS